MKISFSLPHLFHAKNEKLLISQFQFNFSDIKKSSFFENKLTKRSFKIKLFLLVKNS
jgi:hypothetical protein